MKIKKVDDKPMVIHTKKKAKLHRHEPKKASIKASNIYTVDRSPKIKGSKITTTENKKFRRSTIHPVDKAKKGMFRQYRAALKESKQSIKTKNSSIKVVGAAGAQTALSQMEGGEKVRDAANIAYAATRPVTGTASRGAELFRRKALAEKRKRIKKVEAGKKLVKKTAKETAKTVAKEASKETAKAAAKEGAKVAAKVGTTVAGTAAGAETGPYAPLIGIAVGKAVGDKIDKMDAQRNSRNRKIKFFLDKMKAEGEQQDSFAKLVKDLFVNKMALPIKKIMVAVGGFLLVLVLLIAVTVLPVVAVIAILYNSPFAFFLPPLESGDTVTTVTSAYVSEFNRDINTLANEHTGYDTGQIVYVDFEGESAVNFNDIVTIYMVKYGVGDTATVMNDTSKSKLKEVFDDMCSYTTSSGSETTENEDGSTTTQTVLYVNVKLKTCYDMITEYNFDSDQIELVEEMMRMFGSTSGVTPQSALTQAEVDAILQGITDPTQRTVVSYALTKVGYPYSQQYRDTGNYYDCSSLAYYSWKAAGIDISYGGANTAAAEAEGLDSAGHTVAYADMQPGDLIFYSYERNGRYKNISHVAVYVGNGMVVEAKGVAYGVTYNAVPNVGSIVLIGRPQ